MALLDRVSVSRRQLLAGIPATAATSSWAAWRLRLRPPRRRCSARRRLPTIGSSWEHRGDRRFRRTLSIGDPARTFRGQSPDELRQMMSNHFLPTDNVVLDQNALVINTGDKLAVFETGMSSVKRDNRMGRLAANLKLAGIDPKDIDAVIPTHAHIDHIGGIMAEDGSRNFPNAQIHPTQADLRFLDPRQADGHARRGLLARGEEEPAAEPRSHRIRHQRPGRHPGVQAMLTSGHTVGHMSFVIDWVASRCSSSATFCTT